jgi:hypothetical protein
MSFSHTALLILSLSALIPAGLWLAWVVPSIYRAIRR